MTWFQDHVGYPLSALKVVYVIAFRTRCDHSFRYFPLSKQSKSKGQGVTMVLDEGLTVVAREYYLYYLYFCTEHYVPVSNQLV